MKNILLIGVGGTGSRAVDIFYQKRKEFGQQNDNRVTALVFDTDAGDIKNITDATPVVMADPASVGTICDRIGKEYLREWFPCDDPAVRSQEMIRGASQWRKKSYLAFLNLMNKPLSRAAFIGALEKMVADPGASCEIYVISSVAGGTGSGSFIPIALYAKRYLRKNLGKDPIVNAMIALPEIYADAQTPENRVKIYSNAYAILRELNAINLVARGYNEGRTLQKKAPIKFRIGHPDEINVGVLFDASDKAFWNPNAAPFSQVFLLDRIPKLNSVIAHDMVLANSLYTIICTDIGAAFDSEFSNHELLRSQNNGSNAIYAGISTSQIRFPYESVLDYIAHKKTLDSCNSEWLVLHNAVENKIHDKEREAKESRTPFIMKDGEYAGIVLEEFRTLEDNDNFAVVDIVDRGTAILDNEGKKSEKTKADEYMKKLEGLLDDKIAEPQDAISAVKRIFKYSKEDTVNGEFIDGKVKSAVGPLVEYYKNCIDTIKRMTSGTSDAIINLDKKKEITNVNLSVFENLLKKDGKNIHPVAAMVQLCRLRALITAKIPKNFNEWSDIKARNVEKLPSVVINVRGVKAEEVNANEAKSVYAGKNEETRFGDICNGTFKFKDTKSNYKADFAFVASDAVRVAYSIYFKAKQQFKTRIYIKIAHDLDILIAKYRNFFNRFAKEKEELEELTKNALRKDAESVDSVINVYASIDEKEAILKYVDKMSGPATAAEIADTDDVVGKGVFDTVYAAAAAAASDDVTFNDKDASAYRSLFGNMVKSYSESIGKSEAFANIANYNVVEAIVASCGENATTKELETKFRAHFSVAQELAKPSLRIDERGDEDELVQPSKIMVFMMSRETARYIKRNYERFDLQLPADQNKESTVIKACAEEFIRRYSGDSAARLAIVDSMSSQMLYCTGEIMDITPLRIAKFDEMSADNTYFKYYSQSLNNAKRRTTDMWNPHLGNDLHKRGYLPYMNEAKEAESDVKMVKALFYGFSKERIVYKAGAGTASKGNYYFECDGSKIMSPDGKLINNKNIAQLLAWIRNEDELVDKWSALFDKDIMAQKVALPSVVSDNMKEISALESALTNSKYMKMLNVALYTDHDAVSKNNKSDRKVASNGKEFVKYTGPSILEFAYMVKTSEEVGCDCDDAERIIAVAYEVFKDMCSYRTDPAVSPEAFTQVYRQQLGNVYEGLAGSKMVVAAESECVSYFNELVSWLSKNEIFNTISIESPMDESGKLVINERFDYRTSTEDCDAGVILRFIQNNTKKAKAENEETAAE